MLKIKPNARRLLGLLLLTGFVTSCSFESVRQLSGTTKLTPFEEIKIIGGENTVWGERYHPFIGATSIDIDGDGMMEIYVSGGDGFDDMLYRYRDNALVNIIDGTGLADDKVAHGANSIDLDDDGDTDLLLARNDGVFLYVNNGGVFSPREIPINSPADSEPLNVAVGDIDGDGDGDLYVSFFVDVSHFRSATYNDPSHAKTNILLRNDGDFNFTDITESSGTASKQNTFLAGFMDLNEDGWLDLVVAQNTGQVEFFRNRQDGTFDSVEVKTGWGFWMGMATGDIDQDGDQDLFFTNSGSTVPASLLEWVGDGTDEQPRNYGWILLRNDGNFQLRDVTAEYQLDDYGFAWGAIFEDLTLNGELELLVAQNYIKWPFHQWAKLSGKSFVLSESAYYHAPGLGLENYAFSQSPLITDFNNDGKPDVFWVDMEGVGRAFINRTPNNFITLLFPDTVYSIGAKAYAITSDGKSYTREVHNNIGLSTDQISALTFGLGKKTAVEKVVIEWPDGKTRTFDNPPINQIIRLDR